MTAMALPGETCTLLYGWSGWEAGLHSRSSGTLGVLKSSRAQAMMVYSCICESTGNIGQMLGNERCASMFSLAKAGTWRLCEKGAGVTGWVAAAQSSGAALLLLITQRRPSETCSQPSRKRKLQLRKYLRQIGL